MTFVSWGIRCLDNLREPLYDNRSLFYYCLLLYNTITPPYISDLRRKWKSKYLQLCTCYGSISYSTTATFSLTGSHESSAITSTSWSFCPLSHKYIPHIPTRHHGRHHSGLPLSHPRPLCSSPALPPNSSEPPLTPLTGPLRPHLLPLRLPRPRATWPRRRLRHPRLVDP